MLLLRRIGVERQDPKAPVLRTRSGRGSAS
jgi:hypothetical protein